MPLAYNFHVFKEFTDIYAAANAPIEKAHYHSYNNPFSDLERVCGT